MKASEPAHTQLSDQEHKNQLQRERRENYKTHTHTHIVVGSNIRTSYRERGERITREAGSRWKKEALGFEGLN